MVTRPRYDWLKPVKQISRRIDVSINLFIGRKVYKIALNVRGAVEKNGSFAFAEGSALCVGAKANVPFVRLVKIVFKKCAVEKNKNTEALALGSAV
ncbi:MAG: hypothetical protein Q8R50_03930 [Sediminibacterium sp.]|nr:hypothetical protein [Sediminibacterium sp.]